jgi:hypothetical protein
MKEGPSGSAIRSLIPSHRKLLWSKATVVNVAETSEQDSGRWAAQCQKRKSEDIESLVSSEIAAVEPLTSGMI